jgi:cell division transport system ATP-binding protein
VIEFQNVTKIYPAQNRAALENVDMTINKGEFVFLVGPSGSGKSSFLRLILRRFIKRVVPEVLDLVGLEGKHDRMPDELSGGEQQRVAMARAFVNRPMILLADEPTGNIDPATSIGIMKVLDRINRTGTTVVMATHDAAIVDSMRKRVIELEYGKVVRDQNRGVYGQAY